MSQNFALTALRTSFVAIVLCILPVISVPAQADPIDGNWMKKAVDAYNRVNVTRNGSNQDATDSLVDCNN